MCGCQPGRFGQIATRVLPCGHMQWEYPEEEFTEPVVNFILIIGIVLGLLAGCAIGILIAS